MAIFVGVSFVTAVRELLRSPRIGQLFRILFSDTLCTSTEKCSACHPSCVLS